MFYLILDPADAMLILIDNSGYVSNWFSFTTLSQDKLKCAINFIRLYALNTEHTAMHGYPSRIVVGHISEISLEYIANLPNTNPEFFI